MQKAFSVILKIETAYNFNSSERSVFVKILIEPRALNFKKVKII